MNGRTDRQTNRMHNHSLIFSESVINHGTQLKIHFLFEAGNVTHNVPEIDCVILHMNHAIVHLKKTS